MPAGRGARGAVSTGRKWGAESRGRHKSNSEKEVYSSQSRPFPQVCTATQLPTLQLGRKLGRNSLLALPENVPQSLPLQTPRWTLDFGGVLQMQIQQQN